MNQGTAEPHVKGTDADALEGLREVLKDHQLPEAYQRLLTSTSSPWYVMAEAVLEGVDEQSDAWKRMIWFSRILCTAIPTSLKRKKDDAVEQVLQSFINWLRTSSLEAGSKDLALTAAKYVCVRLREQIALDIGQADCTLELEKAPEITEVPGDTFILKEPIDGTAQLEVIDDPAQLETTKNYMQQETTTVDEGVSNMENSILTEAPKEATDTREYESDQAVTERGMSSTDHQVRGKSSSSLIPIGLWLAFHDEDMPDLAKLSVYDRANERYIFANKYGILVREINKPQLLRLLKNDLVNIVEFQKVTIEPVSQNENFADAAAVLHDCVE